MIDIAKLADRVLNDVPQPERGAVGFVVWITGLSGAGKTTTATLLKESLKNAGQPVILLDGDALRELIGAGNRHGREARMHLAFTYSALCLEVARRGHNVICATISLFHQVHQWNRENFPRYLEVYLRVPLEELKRRDSKGLYADALAARATDVVGVHVAAEEPQSPDLLLDYQAERGPDGVVTVIFDKIVHTLTLR
jgi:cytidine diphosphoramidate kinase